MTDFNSIMGDIQQTINVGATVIPFGSFAFGSTAASNDTGVLNVLGNNATSLFGGATKALGGMMNSPMLYIAGGVALLILLK